MTIIATNDGRVISGMLQRETDSAVTLRTINDTVVVAKSDIDERRLSELSFMPEGQLNQLTPDEQRDLIAYLGTPNQVPMRGPSAPIDSKTGRVANAFEGEVMKILSKTAGSASSQSMGEFLKDKWSDSHQLWWRGAKPGALLELELPVADEGTYDVEVALTMARDYGIIQLLIDGEPQGTATDCYDTNVVSTGILAIGTKKLTKGKHRLGMQIIGANVNAENGYMAGLDFIRLVKKVERK